jgi:hypothetical protein
MVVGMWGVKARRLDERRPGEEPMGMRADEPHPHGLYSTNSQGDGWVGKRAV